MSNTEVIIPERGRDIGDFIVGRLLPFRKKKMIGPFIFIDHMGPVRLLPGRYMDIGQHPHIGLSTLTYLLEGELEHRDGLGTRQRIRPGSVNWMTAGNGISHTERTPSELRGSEFTLHGYQIWVALPKTHERMAPEFFHADAASLPKWDDGPCSFTLVAGRAHGRQSPVPVYSNLYFLDLSTPEPVVVDLAEGLYGEMGLISVEGSLSACGTEVEKGSILYRKPGHPCTVSLTAGSRLLVFGGEAFAEERFISWNFVATDKERIREAREAWNRRDFPMMEGEESFIPAP